MSVRWPAILIPPVVLAALASCATNEEERFLGRWKSDESRTLVELRNAKSEGSLTPWAEERFDFLADGFFGRLEVENQPGRSKSWFPDEDPEDVEWRQVRVDALGGSLYRVVDVSADSDIPPRDVKLEPDGRCYRVYQPEMGFPEWFCRSR